MYLICFFFYILFNNTSDLLVEQQQNSNKNNDDNNDEYLNEVLKSTYKNAKNKNFIRTAVFEMVTNCFTEPTKNEIAMIFT